MTLLGHKLVSRNVTRSWTEKKNHNKGGKLVGNFQQDDTHIYMLGYQNIQREIHNREGK